jgi:hypothetical protein
MKLGSFRLLIFSRTVLLGSLLIGALYPTPAGAQGYCGPVTKVNFAGGLGSNGAYPTGYLTTDGQ